MNSSQQLHNSNQLTLIKRAILLFLALVCENCPLDIIKYFKNFDITIHQGELHQTCTMSLPQHQILNLQKKNETICIYLLHDVYRSLNNHLTLRFRAVLYLF